MEIIMTKRYLPTKEEIFVVNPVITWLKNQKADWHIRKPEHDLSETGWDIEAQRRNMDLLIEAKYIAGPFLSSFEGLVTAPLAKRPQHLMKRKYRSWCHNICWAIGSSEEIGNVYQLLLDYFSRNLLFWKHYINDLKLKYIFLVKDKKVAKLTSKKLLEISRAYKNTSEGKKIKVRRENARELMKNIKYK